METQLSVERDTGEALTVHWKSSRYSNTLEKLTTLSTIEWQRSTLTYFKEEGGPVGGTFRSGGSHSSKPSRT